MKLFSLLASVLGVFLITLQVNAQTKLPSVNVKTLEGKTVNIEEYGKKGKVTVISFWATWCSPCKKELDAIADVYDDWKKKYNIDFIAITIDDARGLAKVKPMVKEKGWEYTILSDANKDLQNAMNFQTVPQTFLLDKKGNIVYTHSGYVAGDEFELEKKIKGLK